MLNNPWLGWGLAALGIAAGYMSYGWQGVLLGITAVVFWLLLQFSRAVRALRDASGRPVGQVRNAVMFNAKLQHGMRLPDILRITRSLGNKLADEPETFGWTDDGGDAVHVVLEDGRVARWNLKRAAA